jgi:hypothetical protein
MNDPCIAVFIYRRPDLVRRLMGVVCSVRPGALWIVADGPRSGQESGLCQEARASAEQAVDWPCRIEKVYADGNLGIRTRLETGLDAVFAREEEAILLEEDCLPVAEFFPFCGEMLARYRGESIVGGISGNCFLPRDANLATDYFFSRYLHIWGWATWARAWRNYRAGAQPWPAGGFRHFFPQASATEAAYWNRVFSRMKKGEIQTWDYPWLAHFWSQGWVAITPGQNLVANVGFGPGATHTQDATVDLGIRRSGFLPPPYRGPSRIAADEEMDQAVFRNHFLRTEGRRSLWQKIRDRLSRGRLRQPSHR